MSNRLVAQGFFVVVLLATACASFLSAAHGIDGTAIDVAAEVVVPAAAVPATGGLFKEGKPLAAASVQEGGFPHFSELVRDLSSSVVNISVEADPEEADKDGLPQNPFFRRDPDRQLFSLGSGIIISSDGHIVTNNHVIDKAKRIVVRLLDDKNDYEATLVGKDPKTDLALIKIVSQTPLHAAFFGDSEKVDVGEWVIAIGNQFQLGQTVTAGIVSAKARKVPSRESSPYDSFIQTDASINPGSSGGPLFNTAGQVVGINTAIFSPGRSQPGQSGFNIGIGFAIPINLVKGILPQLKERGRVVRGLLGVIIQPVDKDVAEALKLSAPDGALVADVMPGSPAAKAGFQRQDVIVSYEGHKVVDHDDLPLMVANTAVGRSVSIGVLRSGKTLTLQPTIEEMKDIPVPSAPTSDQYDRLGLMVNALTPEQAKAVGGDVQRGVVVDGVQNGSIAQREGIQRGDVLEELAGVVVSDPKSFAAIVKEIKPNTAVMLLVRRKEGTRFLTLRLK